jgi:hypothetical protein
MKKFSKITNQVIKEQPKENVKVDESSILKAKMITMMNELLKIQSYGSVDNRFLSGSVKIEGKEMLAEALFDLISDISSKSSVKLLEGLKNKIHDWETLDSEISYLRKEDILLNSRFKFNKILEKYEDEGILLTYLESTIPKIKDEKTLSDYKKLVKESNISQETKNRIIELFK